MIKFGNVTIGAENSPILEATMHREVLVIMMGDMGQLFHAQSAVSAIKNHHPNARITVMVRSDNEAMARAMPNVDDVLICDAHTVWEKPFWMMVKKLRASAYERVYDLSLTFQSGLFFRLWGLKKPEWVGHIEWCTHPYTRPDIHAIHPSKRYEELLSLADIFSFSPLTTTWLETPWTDEAPSSPYMVIVPHANHPAKTWPINHYQHLCVWMLSKGITPVLLGNKASVLYNDTIARIDTRIINLTHHTSVGQAITLTQSSMGLISGDTSIAVPLAATHVPSILLCSKHSPLNTLTPQGPHVLPLYEPQLKNLQPADVIRFIETSVNLKPSPHSK